VRSGATLTQASLSVMNPMEMSWRKVDLMVECGGYVASVGGFTCWQMDTEGPESEP